MKKKLLVLAAVLTLGLLATGCSNTDNQTGAVVEPQNEPAVQTEVVVVQQYFASTKYVYDGNDEENGELMPPVEFKFTPKENENKYMTAVDSLRAVPEGQKEKCCTMLKENYKINDITLSDDIAYVDFSSEKLTGGSLNERILIDQIVYTLSESFDEIAAVQFTVDGKVTDTLMGEIDISEAYVADYL